MRSTTGRSNSSESYRLSKAVEEGKAHTGAAEEVKRNVAKLREFKQWLNGLGFRRTFTNPEGLKAELSHGALRLGSAHTAPGHTGASLKWKSRKASTSTPKQS